MNRFRHIIHRLLLMSAVLLMVVMAMSISAFAETKNYDIEKTYKYLKSNIPNPTISGIGGDWFVMAVARSNLAKDATSYIQAYDSNASAEIIANKGVMNKRKVTDNCRVIISMTAEGSNARNIGGQDLTAVLSDFDAVVKQGLNGPIWALIALDCGKYEIPKVKTRQTQTSREKLIEYILKNQLADGGWNMSCDGKGDPDVTAMALQALAKYTKQAKVKTAVDKGIQCLSKLQNSNGGFETWGSETSESAAQVIVAMGELGISFDDPRFVKNGIKVIDNLLTYRNIDGSFRHVKDGEADMMATEQAFYALVSLERQKDGKTGLYTP